MNPDRPLAFEQAPDPATVFGCLLPAPWLGAVAGLLLAFGPSTGLPDRFSPLALAVTHWLALGLLAPVMIGALLQLFPVLAGQPVPGARRISPLVALGSAVVTTGLSFGFLAGEVNGFRIAAVTAMVLYGNVAAVLMSAAWRVMSVDATTGTLRGIPLALAITLSLGVVLAGLLGGWWSAPVMKVLDLHVGWALGGWLAALVGGVATTVVPMFWQTARPGVWWRHLLPAGLWVPLGLATVFGLSEWIATAGFLVLGGAAATGLVALLRAKRRFDAGWGLWVTTASGWLMVAVLALAQRWLPAPFDQWSAWWIGVAALVAGAVAPVNAMLGKIIPFLVFLHLRKRLPAGRRAPPMQLILPPDRLRWQARLLLIALALLAALPLDPPLFARLAGLVFAASQAMLGVLLVLALMRFRRELATALPAAPAIP